MAVKKAEPEAVNLYPISLEAERAVLAALLTKKNAVADILSMCSLEDFTTADHRLVFRIAGELFQKQEPIDMVHVSLAFRKRASVKSSFMVADIFKDEVSPNFRSHAKALKDLTRRRKVQSVLEVARNKIAGDAKTDEIVGEVLSALNQTIDDTVKQPVSLDQVTLLSLKRIEAALEKKSVITGIPTGYHEFDEKMGGFQPGTLTIVGARPGMGKSALLSGIGLGSARMGYPCCIVNAEMELIQVGTRLLAGESGIENFELIRGNVSDSDIPKLVAASGRLGKLPLWIYDDTRWEVIKAQVRALKMRERRLAILFIDYVTRIKAERQYDEKRWEQIGRIAKEAVELGKQLGLAVVMAAQIDRSVAKERREPELNDLRESGDLEQDADMVTFLHQFPDDEKKTPWRFYWLVKKNRNGPIGPIKLHWSAVEVKFRDWNDFEGVGRNVT